MNSSKYKPFPTFRIGAKVKTAFNSPKCPARIGVVLYQNYDSCLVKIQPIERFKEHEEVVIHKNYLSYTR